LAQGIAQPSRRMHTMRVIEQFWAAYQQGNGLALTTQKRYRTELGNVEIRMSPDVFALKGDEERFIYYNFKAEEYDPECARMTLEIAHWLLERNGVEIHSRQLEFFDLFSNVLYTGKKRRSKTIKLLEENAKLIESLWPTITP